MRSHTFFNGSIVIFFVINATVLTTLHCSAQDNMPSFFTNVLPADTTTPVHAHSLNMAALHRIDVVTE